MLGERIVSGTCFVVPEGRGWSRAWDQAISQCLTRVKLNWQLLVPFVDCMNELNARDRREEYILLFGGEVI